MDITVELVERYKSAYRECPGFYTEDMRIAHALEVVLARPRMEFKSFDALTGVTVA